MILVLTGNIIRSGGQGATSSGLPPSGEIRENQGKFWLSGKSGNFNIFCWESGKVRENDLAEVTQSLCLNSRHIFVKTQWLQVQNFSSLRSGFYTILIRSVSWGQGKSGKSVPKKSGKVREFKSSWLVATLHLKWEGTRQNVAFDPGHRSDSQVSLTQIWIVSLWHLSMLSSVKIVGNLEKNGKKCELWFVCNF